MNLKGIHADTNRLSPTLAIEIGLALTDHGGSNQFPIPDEFRSIELDSIRGDLFVIAPKGDENETEPLGSSSREFHVAQGSTVPGAWWANPYQLHREQTLRLAFPVSEQVVRRIEDIRAARKLQIQLVLEISGTILSREERLVLPAEPPNLGNPDYLTWSALRKHFMTRVESQEKMPLGRLRLMGDYMEFQPATIEVSRWIEVLNELGYGRQRLFEIPVQAGELSISDSHLDEAWRKFHRGDWRGSLNESRSVIEGVRRALAERINPVHSDNKATAGEKADKLVESTEALVKAMYDNQGVLLSLGAAGSHPTRGTTVVEREDAELLLQHAMALRQYVARRISQ